MIYAIFAVILIFVASICTYLGFRAGTDATFDLFALYFKVTVRDIEKQR